jgi:hypothetical protein
MRQICTKAAERAADEGLMCSLLHPLLLPPPPLSPRSLSPFSPSLSAVSRETRSGGGVLAMENVACLLLRSAALHHRWLKVWRRILVAPTAGSADACRGEEALVWASLHGSAAWRSGGEGREEEAIWGGGWRLRTCTRRDYFSIKIGVHQKLEPVSICFGDG